MGTERINNSGRLAGSSLGVESSLLKSPAFSLTPEAIETIVNPIVSRIIKKDLFLHLDTRVKENSHPAAEDVYQTILMRLHVQLTNDHGKGKSIDYPHQLIAVIAHNVCNDTIRERFSEWRRTKDKLRHLFKSHQSLALWSEGNRTLCGFKAWVTRKENQMALNLTKYPFYEENLEKIKTEKFKDARPNNLPLPLLVEQTLLWVGSPVNIDQLVDFVIYLTGVKEIIEEPLDPENLPESQRFAYRIDNLLDRSEKLLEIWRLGQKLPLDQRRTFFLTEEDEHGHSLLKEIITGIVAPDEICSALNLTEEELIEWWPDLALGPKLAAVRLKHSYALIKQWRSRAKQKMGEMIGLTKKMCA